MALSRLKDWTVNEILTEPTLEAEFDNIYNNALALISPLTGTLAAGGNDVTGLDEFEFNDAATNASAVGRLRRNANTLTWHDRTGGVSLGPMPRAFIGGLTLSNNALDAVNDIDISVGMAVDSTNVTMLRLTSILVKRIDAAWTVGTNQGGMDTGSVADSTWYHIHVIQRTDTGVVDALFSLSATAPTMPTNYTLRRRIGSVRRGVATNLAFTQMGNYFRLSAAILDADITNPGATAVLRTLTTPGSINSFALINALVSDPTTAGRFAYFSDPSANDEAPSQTVAPLANVGLGDLTAQVFNALHIRTNTSSQIRTRVAASDADTVLRIATLGWIDRRGQDD